MPFIQDDFLVLELEIADQLGIPQALEQAGIPIEGGGDQMQQPPMQQEMGAPMPPQMGAPMPPQMGGEEAMMMPGGGEGMPMEMAKMGRRPIKAPRF